MVEWKTSEVDFDLSKLFVDFDKVPLVKSDLNETELAFIKPLVNSASVLRSLPKK